MKHKRKPKPRRKATPKRSKKRTTHRSCPTGKVGWRHQAEAEAALRKRGRADLETYECRDCGQWHMGGKVSRRVRRHMAEQGRPLAPPTKGPTVTPPDIAPLAGVAE